MKMFVTGYLITPHLTVYFINKSAYTVVDAVPLQSRLTISPSHNILTLGQPVLDPVVPDAWHIIQESISLYAMGVTQPGKNLMVTVGFRVVDDDDGDDVDSNDVIDDNYSSIDDVVDGNNDDDKPMM